MAYYGSGYTDPNGSTFGGFPGGFNQIPGGIVYPVNPIIPAAVVPGVISSPIVGPGAVSAFLEPGTVITPLSSTIIDPTAHIVQTTNFTPRF